MKKILFVLSFLSVLCVYSDEPDWVSLGTKSVSSSLPDLPTNSIFFSIVPNKPIKWIITRTGGEAYASAERQFSNSGTFRPSGAQLADVKWDETDYVLAGVPFSFIGLTVGPWGPVSYSMEVFQADIDECIPPVITSELSITVEAGQSSSYTITATGTTPLQLGVVEDQLFDWSTGSYSDPVILFSPPEDLPPGDYEFYLAVVNDCGADNAILTLTVTAPGTGSTGKVDTDDDVPAINEAKTAIVSAITELKNINISIKNSVTNIENDVSSIKSSTSSIDTEIKHSNVFLEEIRDLLKPDENEDPIPNIENEIPEISIPDVEDNSNIDLDTSKFFDGKFGQLRGTLTEKGSESLSLTIPVSQLLPSLGGSDRLDDWVLNFAAEPLSDWVFLYRSFLLGVLYLGTIFATVRILRTFEF